MRTVESRTCYLGYLAIRRHIRDTNNPIGPWCICRYIKLRNWPAQYFQRGVQGFTVIHQAMVIHRLLVRSDAAPPHRRPAAFKSHRRLVCHRVCCLVSRLHREAVVPIRVPVLMLGTFNRPGVFPSPMSGHLSNLGIRCVVVANVNREVGLFQNAGIFIFQPMVKPAYCFMAPFNPWFVPGVVRIVMVPGADQSLCGRVDIFQHPRQAVAVAVVPATDVITGHLNLLVLTARGGPVPERPVTLLPHVGIDARLYVETILDPLLIQNKVGSARHCIVKVIAHHPGVGMHDAIDVVNIFLVEILGRHHGDECLQGRRVPHCHLDGIEPAPGNAEHTDVAG